MTAALMDGGASLLYDLYAHPYAHPYDPHKKGLHMNMHERTQGGKKRLTDVREASAGAGGGAAPTTTADCNTGGKRARTISRSDIVTTIYGGYGVSPSSPTSASLRTKSDESGSSRSFRDKFAKYDHQHQQGSVVPFKLADPAPKKKASPQDNDNNGDGDDITVSFYQQLVNRLAPPHEKSWNWPNPNSKPDSKNIYNRRVEKKTAGGGRRGGRTTGGGGTGADDEYFVISKKSAAVCCVVTVFAVLGFALARPSIRLG